MDTSSFKKTDLNTVRRLPKRGHYDRETIYNILDRNFICHIAWTEGDRPMMIPTAYGRDGDTLYVHGSSKSRMLTSLADGRPLCFVVMQVNGLVLARSIFHHSVNYESAVIYGSARVLEGDEKMKALQRVSDQIIKGRWDEVRTPSDMEMKATTALAIDIETASAKVRTGPPGDDEADYALDVWAGVLPGRYMFEQPVPDPAMRMICEVSPSVWAKMKSQHESHFNSSL